MNDVTVLILAGGYATRLQPLTEHTPKSLLPIAGKPFLQHQLEHLHRSGVRKVVLALGHQADKILAFLENYELEGLSIETRVESTPTGTAGAIKEALSVLTEVFFVLYGDSYLFCDFETMKREYLAQQKPAMMSVYENGNQHDVSNVLYQDGELCAYDKKNPTSLMTHIDYGLSIFQKALFEKCLHPDLSDFFNQLSKENQLAGFEVFQPFYEVGSFAGIKRFEEYMGDRDVY